MVFNVHNNLKGLHAPFGASRSAWLRYSEEKAISYLKNMRAAERGTRLHEWAAETIQLGIKQANTKKTLNRYINDAIGYRMNTEVILYYSEYFFGTTDAISFKNNMLRIHDLKTGVNPANMEQLMVYAALFCLEYKINPADIKIELRLYQNDEIIVHDPEVDEIVPIIDKIIYLDKIIKQTGGEL